MSARHLPPRMLRNCKFLCDQIDVHESRMRATEVICAGSGLVPVLAIQRHYRHRNSRTT